MANEYFTHSGYPVTRAQGDSSSMRAQLAAIAAGFDKMPALSGNALRLVRVNAGATALESVNTIDGIVIGGTTPAAGTFTTLSTTGNVTLGNAGGDTLTVNPSAVTWVNNPTHSGNHTFSGGVSVSGQATFTGDTLIGNATGDTLTVAGATINWTGNPTHSGNHTFSGTVSMSNTLAVTGAMTSVSTARFNGAEYGSLGVRQGGVYGGIGANSNNDDFVIENSGNAGITILTPNTAVAALNFGDPESNVSFRLVASHSTNVMTLIANGTTALTIDQPAATITIGGAFESIVSDVTPTTALSAGFRGVPSIGNTATATKAAVGKVYKNTGNLAINNSVFAADDVFAVYNNSASSITLNGTITTMRLAGTTTTGNRTIAPRGMASVFFVSATECIVSGSGVS